MVIVFCMVMTVVGLQAQADWTTLGDGNDIKNCEGYQTFDVASNGDIYVAYRNTNSPGMNIPYLSTTVMKYTKATDTWHWTESDIFARNDTGLPALKLSPQDVPYVIFPDRTENLKGTVMKYNGSYWEGVGPRGMTDTTIDSPANIEFSPSGTLYISYTYQDTVTVKKFNGVDWETVGETLVQTGVQQRYYGELGFTSDDTPYVTFREVLFSQALGYVEKASVLQFNGTSWMSLPGNNFVKPFNGSDDNITYFTMEIAADDTIYAAYLDSEDRNAITVIEFTGSEWVQVGSTLTDTVYSAPVSQSPPALATDSNSVPYITYKARVADVDPANPPIVVDAVMVYDGADWRMFNYPAGQTGYMEGYSNGIAQWPRLLIDTSGEVYLTYNNPSLPEKTFVVKGLAYPAWEEGIYYGIGAMVSHNGAIWECVYHHRSQLDWYPGAPGIWFWEER